MRALVLFGIFACMAPGAVVDRVAVVVGNRVITESEVLEEVRLTEFQNGEPLDLGPARRRAAAQRLVDQELIRNEMRLSDFRPQTDPAALLAELRKSRFSSDARFREALQEYGITEAQLKMHLAWQQSVLEFTDLRFGPEAPPPQEAERMQPGASPAPTPEVDSLDVWLKQARADTRIQFKPEAFE